MNSIRNVIPASNPTARRLTRLSPVAILFTAALFGAVSCTDDNGVGPLNPVELGYIDSVASADLKAEGELEGSAVKSPSSVPSLSAASATAAAASYTVAAIPFKPEPRTGLRQEPGADDFAFGALDIGFNFMFYGQTYNKFWIASNGAILFEFIEMGACCGAMIPFNDPPTASIPRPKNNLIALAWNDYVVLPSQISWGVRGTAPNRRLIVDFNQVGYFQCMGCAPTPQKVTTQAILYERTNVIEIHTTLQENTGRKLVTQGIENRTGTEAAFLPGRNRAVYTLANDAVRFTPVNQNAVPDALPGGNAGGPPANRYDGVEGEPIAFRGSGRDADGDALTYSWDFNGDGVPDAETAEASYTYDDNGKFLATLTVNDGRGGINHASVDVIVKNAAPSVRAGQPARIDAGQSLGFSGDFSDKGTKDALWSWTWNLGAEGDAFGSLESQGPVPAFASHRFCKAGKFPVKLTVTDKDGDYGTAEFEVTVDALPVEMDISPNTINLNGNGHAMLTVRIYSRAGLDATTLNPDVIRLTGAGGRGTQLARTGGGLWHWNADADLNGDGLLDVVAGFRRDELIKNGDLNLNSTQLKLSGQVGDCGDVESTVAVRAKVQAKDKSAAGSIEPTGPAATPIPATP